ncbi:MAG: PPC domain-containing DNA-binding protein [Bacillota bacterium]|jgi:predicted DNA-binding protein with PD1-like motif
MQATEVNYGRIYLLRLEEGDPMPSCIEDFAKAHNIKNAFVHFMGGLYNGHIVVGPHTTQPDLPQPVKIPVHEAHESIAFGVLACDQKDNPILHIHGSLGRMGQTVSGCLRPGIDTWLVGEVIVQEIITDKALRIPDEKSGFTLLRIKK